MSISNRNRSFVTKFLRCKIWPQWPFPIKENNFKISFDPFLQTFAYRIPLRHYCYVLSSGKVCQEGTLRLSYPSFVKAEFLTSLLTLGQDLYNPILWGIDGIYNFTELPWILNWCDFWKKESKFHTNSPCIIRFFLGKSELDH